jgi:hypothetical protein
VAEAANSVINVHWAVMRLRLDLIDYVLKWTMRRCESIETDKRCKSIETNKQCIRPEWLMAPRPSSTLSGRGKDGREAIGGGEAGGGRAGNVRARVYSEEPEGLSGAGSGDVKGQRQPRAHSTDCQ